MKVFYLYVLVMVLFIGIFVKVIVFFIIVLDFILVGRIMLLEKFYEELVIVFYILVSDFLRLVLRVIGFNIDLGFLVYILLNCRMLMEIIKFLMKVEGKVIFMMVLLLFKM